MKTLLKKTVISCLLLVYSNFIIGSNMQSNLIDIAKEQRVLSQKIAKSYLLLAYGANFHEIRSEIKTSTILFENNLNVLKSDSRNEFSELSAILVDKEAAVWDTFKNIISQPPNKNRLNDVIIQSNNLLKKAHRVYSAFKTEASSNFNHNDSNVVKLIQISEKQEITSQRLCLYFVAQKINVVAPQPNHKILTTLRVIVDKLDKQLVVLLKQNINNPVTVKIINDALIAFDDIKTNKTDFLDGKPSMNTIYKTTKKLNSLFRILSSEYQVIASL